MTTTESRDSSSLVVTDGFEDSQANSFTAPYTVSGGTIISTDNVAQALRYQLAERLIQCIRRAHKGQDYLAVGQRLHVEFIDIEKLENEVRVTIFTNAGDDNGTISGRFAIPTDAFPEQGVAKVEHVQDCDRLTVPDRRRSNRPRVVLYLLNDAQAQLASKTDSFYEEQVDTGVLTVLPQDFRDLHHIVETATSINFLTCDTGERVKVPIFAQSTEDMAYLDDESCPAVWVVGEQDMPKEGAKKDQVAEAPRKGPLSVGASDEDAVARALTTLLGAQGPLSLVHQHNVSSVALALLRAYDISDESVDKLAHALALIEEAKALVVAEQAKQRGESTQEEGSGSEASVGERTDAETQSAKRRSYRRGAYVKSDVATYEGIQSPISADQMIEFFGRASSKQQAAEFVRESRIARDWTQEGLAKRAKVTVKVVNSIENAATNWKIESFQSICAALMK